MLGSSFALQTPSLLKGLVSCSAAGSVAIYVPNNSETLKASTFETRDSTFPQRVQNRDEAAVSADSRTL